MSNATAITIDRSEFPILIVRYRGAPTTDEFGQYLDRLSAVYREGNRFAMIFDSSDAESPPATQRKMQADWILKHERLIHTLNVGTAFVVPSVVLRGALTAIFWLQPLPCPHFVCAELNEARRWTRARLDAASSHMRS